jgi:hypothetical protein
MPPRVSARTPRTPYCSRSQTLAPSIRPLVVSPTLAAPCFPLPPPLHQLRRRRRRGGGGGAPREGRRRNGAPPGRRPYDDVNEAARPARPRPTCTGPPPLRVSRLRALGERRRRSLPSFSPAAGMMLSAADEPSVANPRTPSPIQPPCRLFVQEPVTPPLHPAAVVAPSPPCHAVGPGCQCPADGTATPRP